MIRRTPVFQEKPEYWISNPNLNICMQLNRISKPNQKNDPTLTESGNKDFICGIFDLPRRGFENRGRNKSYWTLQIRSHALNPHALNLSLTHSFFHFNNQWSRRPAANIESCLVSNGLVLTRLGSNPFHAWAREVPREEGSAGEHHLRNTDKLVNSLVGTSHFQSSLPTSYSFRIFIECYWTGIFLK